MPVLWNERMVGWANVKIQKGVLHFDLGYAEQKPTEPDFYRELDLEVGRLENFLKLK